MRIAILSFYSGFSERGVENWTKEIATRLSLRHDVTVFQAGSLKEEKIEYKIIAANFKINWNKPSSKGTIFRKTFVDYWSLLIGKFAFQILPILWKGDFDVVVPTDGGWEPAFLRILTWLRGKKMVIVGHSGRGWDDRNNIYCFPDCFVALTKSAERWAKKINPLIKVTNIPDGVDLDKFSPVGKTATLPFKRPIVLAVGSADKGKRLELAIEAVAKMKDVNLLILGNVGNESRLKELGERKLKDRFLMMSVPHEEIPGYYRAADVFTLPSWGNEAFGMVYLEAMASGLPVVATRDEMRSEIIGDAGFLADPTDAEAYSRALDSALNKDWGDSPRREAEKFSWDKILQKYEELFEDLVK